MIVSGAIVTVSYDGQEHKCPADPTKQPFYTVRYEMEDGYKIESGVKAENVLTDPTITTPATGTAVGTYYLGIGTTYKPYYADPNNVEIKN